ncbi:helix-turn-helix domain-containing protein [Kineobactrum salinum]|uniref:Helix-turn-helix transcriptional regulator n=1 Tax=Kineobactrum salinum TaxID=2708301 RepID=A0A6C0U6Z5_9GAMM|nr:helix-turn-helix transcriptional regulator [Kineobactrum salinum]QIB67109.1 helix-turn-helix transcriptional regulator [Kineobactrum salinum]
MSPPTQRYTATANDKKRAARLRRIWDSKKGELGLTQKTASRTLGISQPSLSQYLHAVIPLNTEIVFKFAAILRVSPLEIDPSLENVTSLLNYKATNLQQISVSLIGSLTGKSVMGRAPAIVEDLSSDSNYAGISVDSNDLDEHGIPQGSTLVLDLDKDPRVKNRMVAFRLRNENGYRVGQYMDATSTGHRVAQLLSKAPRVLRSSDILSMHLVQSVQMP